MRNETSSAGNLNRRSLIAGTATTALLSPAYAQGPAGIPDALPDRPALLIRGATIVSLDPSVGDLPSGDIMVRDGAIVSVGPTGAAPPSDAAVIEAAGLIAVPGFVNGHVHLAQTLQRGLSTDHSFADYFRTVVLRYSARMTPDDVRLGDHAGALDALSSGTTTVMDWSRETSSPDHADAAVDGLMRSGVRAILAYTIAARPPDGQDGPGQRMVEHARRLRAGRLASDAGRVTLAACLPGPDFMPLEPALADLRLLRELDVLTSFHCGAPIYAQRKPNVLGLLDERGLLPRRLQVVHANDLSGADYRLAAERGASIASTPEVEMHMGHGLPGLWKAREAGMGVALGTDIPSAVGSSMLAQLRIALSARLAELNAAAFAADGKAPARKPITARAALELITVEAARALGLDRQIGTLSPGKRADILLVRGGNPETSPVLDTVGTVVFQASPADIETVLVDGKVLKWRGKLIAPDVSATLSAARDRASQMVEAAKAP